MDEDGQLEVVVTKVESNKELRWFAQELESGENFDLGTFGQEGWLTNIGKWKDSSTPQRAVIRKDDVGQFRLMLESGQDDFILGVSRDVAYVFPGRNINNNSTSDSVLVGSNRRLWSWKFSFDPYSSIGPNFKRIIFGEKNGSPLLFRNRGSSDSLGILIKRGDNWRKILYRSLNGKLVRKIRLRNILQTNSLPLIMREFSGRDQLIFTYRDQESATAIKVDLSGRIISSHSFPENATIIAGYFSDKQSEELAYLISNNLFLSNNYEEGMQLLGELNDDDSRKYGYQEISPTPIIPTTPALPTALPSVPTAFTPVATSTASTPTSTATQPLAAPSTTATSTPTATVTSTRTNTPTITPTPDTSPPAGFIVTIDQNVINSTNYTSISFTVINCEIGTTLSYNFDDSNSGTPPVSGSTIVAGSTTVISGINLASLDDGLISLAATLRDSAGNTSAPGLAARNKETTVPAVNSVSTTNGTYSPGQNIDFTLALSESVIVGGTPRLVLNVSGITRYAVYASGSNTASLTFRYQVQSNDTDNDGIGMNSSIDLNGGSAQDAYLNNLNLSITLPNLTNVRTYGSGTSCLALRNSGVNSSGEYQIDPDGSGGLGAFTAYCDMTTDGGGWTLVMNYLHKQSTSPGLSVRTTSLPRQNGTTLGGDESTLSGGIYWGHASNSLMNLLSFNDLRFYCIRASHSRAVHFKSSLSNCISYFKTGTGNCSGLNTSYTPLSGHTAVNIPQSANTYDSNKGDGAMRDYTFQNSSGAWNVWDGCDDNFFSGSNLDSHHQIWVR